MATLAELIERREKLLEVRDSGTLSGTYADGSGFTYRSDREIAAALADLDRRISSASGTKPVRMIRFNTSKGV